MAKKTELFDGDSENVPDNINIRIDQIFDICDYSIRRCWNELLSEKEKKEEIPFEKVEKILETTYTSWSLLTEVLGVINDSSNEIVEEVDEDLNNEDLDEDTEDFDK